MSIFGKPKVDVQENDYGVKVLYLHGLEGSPQGTKSQYLKKNWAAFTPALRTQEVANLRAMCAGNWKNVSFEEIEVAMVQSYQDAIDAVNYLQPDIIVGSSLGAAILYRLYTRGHYNKAGVFLAPAIPHLLPSSEISEGYGVIPKHQTYWVLGEVDTIVSNPDNAAISKAVSGNLIYSPNDTHRLHKAIDSGLVDAAILTVIENTTK